MRRLAFVLVGMLGFASSAHAGAILITSEITFTVNWLNTATSPDLSGEATFEITNFTATSFDLAISDIKNTTLNSPDIDARLTSFGFGLTPDATGFANAVDGSVYHWGNTNFPGFQTVDICGYAGQNCAGGDNAGLNQGQSLLPTDIMSITVFGNFANGVTFDPLAAKFQTAVGSFEIDGTPSCVSCDPTPVPEPASLMLLGSGGVAAALARRRRRNVAEASE